MNYELSVGLHARPPVGCSGVEPIFRPGPQRKFPRTPNTGRGPRSYADSQGLQWCRALCVPLVKYGRFACCCETVALSVRLIAICSTSNKNPRSAANSSRLPATRQIDAHPRVLSVWIPIGDLWRRVCSCHYKMDGEDLRWSRGRPSDERQECLIFVPTIIKGGLRPFQNI